ncbi:efflux RND transporter periplasmic adaptor subunit [Chthoniobacter flavus]|nr:efflux RND transporter periplasmic adaptor subunit [Chthoniobacter flavus]
MPPRENPHSPSSSQPPPLPPEGGRSSLVLGVLIVAAILAAAIGYSVLSRMKAEASLKKTTLAEATPTFNIVHPSPVVSSGEITLPGSAQAYMDTAIYARTNGYLKSFKVDIGAHVKQGDLLAEIETPEVDQQLEQARADLKNAQANLSLAQLTDARSEDLFKKKTISPQERDQARTDLAAKRALVDSGEANVRRLEQLRAFEKVVAPFDGVVTARSTDVGALIQASSTGGAKELFHLADNHILRVYFSVPEIYASSVKHNEEVAIAFDAFPGEKFTGKLIRDSASLDPLSHTLNVEADVENPAGRLLPGGYATVHLNIPGTPGAVTIPANTLLFRSEGPRVGVIRDGHVALVPIEIGHDFGNTLEVLSGLKAEDAVVLDPPDSLTDGETARGQEAPPKTAATPAKK